MDLTIAITVLNDYTHKLIGPYNGCPILYVRDEDNPDKKQGLRTDEFFNYLYKNGCFNYIYKVNFDEMISGVDIGYRGSVNTNNTDKFVNVYRKVKERFRTKLSKDTFIQSIQERLQKREKWNLTEKNINGVVNILRNILENEQ